MNKNVWLSLVLGLSLPAYAQDSLSEKRLGEVIIYSNKFAERSEPFFVWQQMSIVIPLISHCLEFNNFKILFLGHCAQNYANFQKPTGYRHP